MRKLMMLVGCVALAAAAACSRGVRVGSAESTIVDFRNESSEQAGVYVVGPAGEESRLGTVNAGMTQQLRVPDDFVRRGAVSFYARLLARSDRPSTGRVNMQVGDRFRITLPASLGSLSVLPGG
jgi:hypothetical protein